MVFSEVYSKYYSVVAAILKEAGAAPITEKRIRDIVNEDGFAESVLTIPDALKERKWPFLDEKGTSLFNHEPRMPLTVLEKRWIKSLLLDPKIALFLTEDITAVLQKLEDVTPLFTPDKFVYFDQYQDGDDYKDSVYQEHFHMVLTAQRVKRKLQIRYLSKKGKEKTVLCTISHIEYSLKDDKFRVIGAALQFPRITINMSNILQCKYSDKQSEKESCQPVYQKRELELELTDHRNALERAMLHFSHFEKMTEKIDETHYRFLIQYAVEDETELLIRVLSFGPLIKVVGPDEFINQIKDRLLKQKSCGLL